MTNNDVFAASYLTNRTCVMCGNPDSEHDTLEGHVCSTCYRNGNYQAFKETASQAESSTVELQF